LRKIDQQISIKGHATSPSEAAPYSKMLSLATKGELIMMVLGHTCAALTGFAIPVFSYLFGDVLDGFGP
jgi:hypothetical protein